MASVPQAPTPAVEEEKELTADDLYDVQIVGDAEEDASKGQQFQPHQQQQQQQQPINPQYQNAQAPYGAPAPAYGQQGMDPNLVFQYLIQQQQAAKNIPQDPEPDMEEDPKAWTDWKTRQQMKPIQEQMEQNNRFMLNNMSQMAMQSAASQFPDWGKYQDLIYQTARQISQYNPAVLTDAKTWAGLYMTAKGMDYHQREQQQTYAQQQPTGPQPFPQAAQQAPITGHNQMARPSKKRVQLTSDEVETAKKFGMSPAEYAQYRD